MGVIAALTAAFAIGDVAKSVATLAKNTHKITGYLENRSDYSLELQGARMVGMAMEPPTDLIGPNEADVWSLQNLDYKIAEGVRWVAVYDAIDLVQEKRIFSVILGSSFATGSRDKYLLGIGQPNALTKYLGMSYLQIQREVKGKGRIKVKVGDGYETVSPYGGHVVRCSAGDNPYWKVQRNE